LPYITHLFADLTDVQQIIDTVGLGLGLPVSSILPTLQKYIW
jgi:hypothetical protein